MHKAKAKLEAERAGKSRLVPGANKTGGLKRLGIGGASAEDKLPAEERDRKRLDTYLARCEGVALDSSAVGSAGGAGAKQAMAKDGAIAGMRLRMDLEQRRVSQSIMESQSQMKRGSIANARHNLAAVHVKKEKADEEFESV